MGDSEAYNLVIAYSTPSIFHYQNVKVIKQGETTHHRKIFISKFFTNIICCSSSELPIHL